MGAWIIGLAMAAMAGITLIAVGVALRLHFQDELHIRERDDARRQRDRLNTRNAELVEEVQKLQAMLAESERELTQCRIEQRALALKLAKALSKPRTVPIRRIDATKPGARAMIGHYILDEQGEPVLEPDFMKYARWFEAAERHIGNTWFGDIQVSTVFLGIDHSFSSVEGGSPVLWETMVFADEATLTRLMELSETDDRSIFAQFFGGIDIQKRYSSRHEAEEGHQLMCTFIATRLEKGLLAEQEQEP